MSLRNDPGRATSIVHTDFGAYLDGLTGQQNGNGTLAFFDLDRTLIAGYSVSALVWARLRSDSVPLRRLLSAAMAFLRYGLGRVDYHELLATTVRDLGGESSAKLEALGERAFRERVRGWIYDEARVLVDTHRRAGHHLVMVTSATRFQAAPVARDLGLDELCCTEVEEHQGVITGNARPCFGVGKLAAAEHIARMRRAAMAHAYFYSDSSDDLPLLEAVGRPVVVNPKPAMARLARARGWPSLMFQPPGGAPPTAA